MASKDTKIVALVPPLPKGCELSAEHREQLHTSGLSDVTIGGAQVYTETSATKLAELVRWSKWSLGSGLIFPFFVPGRAEPVMYRVKPARPLTETKKGKTKTRKYEQPRGVDVMPYFPPNARKTSWYRDLTKPVLWTEGEKKSLLLDQLGYATVGGTGITCFHAKRDEEDSPFVLHALTREHVAIAGREHRIVFDSDAEEKPEVMHAARRLAGMLEAAGAGRVLFIRIPHGADGSKLGIDDYYVAHGEDATRALLEQGGPIAGLPPEEVYEPLSNVSAFKGADLPKKLRMPWGYSVDRTGCVWKKPDRPEGEEKLIAKAPIVVRRIVLDLYTGEERVELSFKRRGAWKTLLIGREDMLSSRSIVPAVAKHGAPVESGSAAGIVTWLSDLELANDKRLPRTTCVSRCG